MAEKIRKYPTSHAEKGDKNGDRENTHSCLTRKKVQKMDIQNETSFAPSSPLRQVMAADSALVVVGLALSPAGWLPQGGLCGGWDFGLATRFSGLFCIWDRVKGFQFVAE
ncbi:hypothetical protein HFK74_25230|uniref:hypothetical protein n=1 Tax=Pseudomonas sp. SbOxS1 TaxID=2723884 RepID=UPI0015D392C4|nr:hypothetical protein [Pseudomonas sp. SbOxS1]NYU06008.1 hypothetical protein [Pseudomonas sp. SbOxS1]